MATTTATSSTTAGNHSSSTSTRRRRTRTAGVAVTATERPPCPIQRILIFHRRLYEKSLLTNRVNRSKKEKQTTQDGQNEEESSAETVEDQYKVSSSPPSLGEDATIEELAESILYYHQDRRLAPARAATAAVSSYTRSQHPNNDHDDYVSVGNQIEKTEGKPATEATASAMMTDAIQFLGLCSALFSLPSILDDDDEAGNDDGNDHDDKHDKTRAVYLSRSTLIFVPLETRMCPSISNSDDQTGIDANSSSDSDDILAVIQLARLYPNDNGADDNGDSSRTPSSSGGVGGGHPRAVRASIEQWHKMFELLYGGGILHRLGSYENMADLYSLLKDIRKLRNSYNKIMLHRPNRGRVKDDINDNNNTNEGEMNLAATIEGQIVDKQNDVRKLRKQLAIQSIRRDLDVHYKEYLSEYGFIFSWNGGVGRCLVECAPAPIPYDGDDNDNTCHSFRSMSSSLTMHSKTLLKESVRQLLLRRRRVEEAKSKPTRGEMKILGVASFHAGDLIDFQIEKREDSDRDGVSADLGKAARLLMAYMASHRTKMKSALRQVEGASASGKNAAQEASLGIGKIAMSFTSMGIGGTTTNHASMPTPIGSTSSEKEQIPLQNLHRGQFLQAPPSYMMSSGNDIQSIVCGGTHNIWAPRVSLPSKVGIQHANMILFDYMQFSFLIFVEPMPQMDKTDEGVENVVRIHAEMMTLEEELSEASLLALQNNVCRSTVEGEILPPATFQIKSGQLVLAVHRGDNKMILVMDPSESVSHTSHNRHTVKTTNENPTNKFLRFFNLGKKPAHDREIRNNNVPGQPGHMYTSIEWSALGLDCRHLLASRLPLDACLAFDDIIDEAQSRIESTSGASSASNDYEICISMPFGWILAIVRGGMEIYICFDRSYVTVADVQSAAASIAKQIEEMLIPALK